MIGADHGAAALEVDGLRKTFGERRVLWDVSLNVPPGASFGIVGEPGAGKTTLVRTLATLLPPDAGTIRISGIDIDDDPSGARDRIGYMPEIFGSCGPLTAREYLAFYTAAQDVPPTGRAQLVRDLLDLVDLSERSDSPVDSLSEGEKRRLSLARCLIHDPEILLMDEPLRGVDWSTREGLVGLFVELTRLGKTLVSVARDPSDLDGYCEVAGCLQGGTIAMLESWGED